MGKGVVERRYAQETAHSLSQIGGRARQMKIKVGDLVTLSGRRTRIRAPRIGLVVGYEATTRIYADTYNYIKVLWPGNVGPIVHFYRRLVVMNAIAEQNK